MKVVCKNIINHFTGQIEQENSWITVGKEYLVLAIEIRRNKVMYLIATDSDKQPALQDAIQFDIVSQVIPNSWRIISGLFGQITLEPKDWGEAEFWDDLYNQDEKALEIYKREARIMHEEEVISSKQNDTNHT